ncbi:hypothetical protein IW261DRAFT_1571025 [Armillaria novae-zelandiae]|uniref:Uncharacterized protein n=1 Tax=Armillaria novae-zelandiae TaxID=153914 RepID=A0AA39T8Y5_9AGAR|nr:hypothetical protein IW261DRAFT_1571025 [Armillaria novae-zelandiae]
MSYYRKHIKLSRMAASNARKAHDLEELDPRWKSYPLKRKQSQVFDEKVPIYLNQYRRLNPRLVSWKHVKPEDQNALVALQNTLIRDIFNHEYFDQGIHIDLITHSRKQWEDNFRKGFKNHADHLKNAQSSLSTNPRMDSSDGSHPPPEPKPSDNPRDVKHTSDAIHKLAKMLRLSGNLTGRQWFELEKKAEIKAFLAEKHHARCVGGSNEAGTEGASLDLENPGGEYQLTVKLWWNALTSEKQAEWDKEVKKIEHSIADNREDLPFVIPDFLDLLCSDKVIGPALCYFYVAWCKEDGRPTVLSYANMVNGKTLQEIVTDREVGATPEEHKHAWGSRLAREAAMILPESLAVRSTTEDFPPFVPFDKTKCTPDQRAKYIHTFFDTVWNHCNPTMVLPWQELMVAPEKFYDQTIHKFPVPIRDSSITPYTINECVMLLEYLEKECVAGTDHPFHFYSVLTCTSAAVLSSRSTDSFAHALPPALTLPQPSPSFRKPPSSPDNPPLSSLLGHPRSPSLPNHSPPPPLPLPPSHADFSPKTPNQKAIDLLQPLTPEDDLHAFLASTARLENPDSSGGKEDEQQAGGDNKRRGKDSGGKKRKTVTKKKAIPARKAGTTSEGVSSTLERGTKRKRGDSVEATPPPKRGMRGYTYVSPTYVAPRGHLDVTPETGLAKTRLRARKNTTK